jgi:hypothetical protein
MLDRPFPHVLLPFLPLALHDEGNREEAQVGRAAPQQERPWPGALEQRFRLVSGGKAVQEGGLVLVVLVAPEGGEEFEGGRYGGPPVWGCGCGCVVIVVVG